MTIFRRSFLQSVLGGGVALSSAAAFASQAESVDEPFIFAFLTDTHLPDGKPDVAERVAKLIDQIQDRPHAPKLVVFGGDNVMAIDGRQSDEKVEQMLGLFKSQVMDRLRIPSLSCIGNHDIRWKDRDADKPDSYAEKRKATETYKMPNRFYSADHGGWTYIMLDTYHYTGCEIDEAQWAWLAEELSKSEQPVCIVTHAPLFSATHFLEPSVDTEKGYAIPPGWSPRGLNRFRELVQKHPRVKLCLSGHMHTCDRVDIDNVTYICGGAVSGNWWHEEEKYLGFPPCWIEVKTYPDGRWSYERQVWT